MATLKKKEQPPAREEVRQTLAQPQPDAPKNKGGRPKGPPRVPISFKIRSDVFDDMKRIADREGLSVTTLVERAVAVYEERRLDKALELVERQEGETDDAVIRRAFGW